MWISRALLSLAVAIGPAGCLLAVSTSGLAGDPLDAAPASETFVPDVGNDTSVAEEAGADVRDAFAAPDGATVYGGNGHAYLLVVPATARDWNAARDLATSMGGHLATIGDAGENQFVLDLVKAHPEAIRSNGVGPWLGGYQSTGSAEPGGGWTWVDGTPWVYTDWSTGQPDNTSGTENYLNWYGPDGTVFAWNDDSIDGTEAPIISLLVEFE